MNYIYIMVNKTNKVMYIGVTSDIKRRVYEHKNEMVDGFTKKYHTHKLVYYEEYTDIRDAITREKQLKGWCRSKKNDLVESANKEWRDLGEEIYE